MSRPNYFPNVLKPFKHFQNFMIVKHWNMIMMSMMTADKDLEWFYIPVSCKVRGGFVQPFIHIKPFDIMGV